MALYASKILKLVVDQFRDASVSEVRFVSGMSPAFVKRDGPRYLDLGSLSCERVAEIHALCSVVADEPVEESENASTYTFVLKHFGRVVCMFERHGSASSLIMVRDSYAKEMIAAVRPKQPPSLRTEATPDWNADKN
jgi:hypothetical protein